MAIVILKLLLKRHSKA